MIAAAHQERGAAQGQVEGAVESADQHGLVRTRERHAQGARRGDVEHGILQRARGDLERTAVDTHPAREGADIVREEGRVRADFPERAAVARQDAVERGRPRVECGHERLVADHELGARD